MTVSLSDPPNATQLLCGCGCGTELVVTRSYRIPTYAPWHAVRTRHPIPEPQWDGDCLRWQGRHQSNGYGTWYDRRLKKKNTVHRIFWEMFNGPIPSGMTIDHVYSRGCRFTDCFRISHMEVVTQEENNRRKVYAAKCKWGHLRTEENTLLVHYPTHVMKACRPCATNRNRKLRATKIAKNKELRDPCVGCGTTIPESRNLRAKFCTEDCKILFHSRARRKKKKSA